MTLKERLANKDKIKEMSLIDIKNKYHLGDLLCQEILKRKDDKEQVDVFFAYLTYEEQLILLDKLNYTINPMDIISHMDSIPYEICQKYLTRDYSWVSTDIIDKVDINFLQETILNKDVNLDSINNLENITSKLFIVKSEASMDIIKRLISDGRIDTVIKLINYDYHKGIVIKDNISEVIEYACNNLSQDNLMNLVNGLKIDYDINIIIQRTGKKYFLSNLKNITNKDQILSILSTLDNTLLFAVLSSNNVLYELFKDKIDISDFYKNYFLKNLDKYLNNSNNSLLIEDCLKIVRTTDIINDIGNVEYLLNNKNIRTKLNINLKLFLSNLEEVKSILNNKELLIELINCFENSNDLIGYLEEREDLLQLFINNDNFKSYITSSKENILKYHYLINKYNITSSLVSEVNEGLDRLITLRPELSSLNSSLKECMLEENFVNIFGKYTNAILEFDTDASVIVEKMYNDGNLVELKKWLDYVCEVIPTSNRMIHYYCLAYPKMIPLIKDILDNKPNFSKYELEILEEVISNFNKYDLKTINDLKNYFNIKAQSILNKDDLSYDDVIELFLNKSSLINGNCWNLNYFSSFVHADEMEYLRYKGILSDSEISYLIQVYSMAQEQDKSEILEFATKCRGIEIPSLRTICLKIKEHNDKELKNNLSSLSELRKVASTADKDAPVYLEVVDGVEYIYVNDYDFRCLASFVSRKDYKQKSTIFIDGFQENVIYGEKIKESLPKEYKDIKSIGDMILDSPESFNLMEGVSTISTGINNYIHPYDGLGWAKDSAFTPLVGSKSDAQACHNPRALIPNSNDFNKLTGWYGEVYNNQRGEIVLDRYTDDEHLKPEFVLGKRNKEFAKYYHIPVIIQESKTKEEIEKHILKLKQKFLTNMNYSLIPGIWFYSKEKEETYNFILNGIIAYYKDNKQDLYNKLIEYKWLLYEIDNDYYRLLNDYIDNTLMENISMKRGYTNIFLILTITIIMGIILANILVN